MEVILCDMHSLQFCDSDIYYNHELESMAVEVIIFLSVHLKITGDSLHKEFSRVGIKSFVHVS